MVRAEDFGRFFEEVHGKRPFPWQTDLANRILAGEWPRSIALPTAAGKTALIDIAVFALAAGAPGAARRIFFVVDRRVVVDEAAERAGKLQEALRNPRRDSATARVAEALRGLAGRDYDEETGPLFAGRLRGGIRSDEDWARSALQPMVCCSTVDQIGSSILFRSYGSRSNRNWPIRAGLSGNDSLLIIDEAHTAQPFVQTLEWVAAYRRQADEAVITAPLRVIEMSATPRDPGQDVFRETDGDWEDDCLLSRRWKATKPASLVVAEAAGEAGAAEGNFDGLVRRMAQLAVDFAERGAKVIGVVANRVATARAIHSSLRGRAAYLLTGRSRPYDREEIWRELAPLVKLGRPSQPDEAVFVVATQCIEVGADLDFDALVTEIASIDALEQRFGRLNRDGRAIEGMAAVVAQKDQTASKYVDAIYGERLQKTWRWLTENAVTVSRTEAAAATEGKKAKPKKIKASVVDMGVGALRRLLEGSADRTSLMMVRANAPVLMPAHLDRLSETCPEPGVEPDVALFLHGPQSAPPDVNVVWRADLTADATKSGSEYDWFDTVSAVPPQRAEMLAVPVWSVRKWLARETAEELGDLADIEGAAAEESRGGALRDFLVWRGADEREAPTSDSKRLRPGATIIVPGTYGGCDRWGWSPASKEPVKDVADAVGLERGRPSMRLDRRIVGQWESPGKLEGSLEELESAETDAEVRASLRRISSELPEGSLYGDLARALLKANRKRFRGERDGAGVVLAVVGLAPPEHQESNTASYTVEIALEEHLKDCRHRIGEYAEALRLPDRVAATLREAAAVHDWGKADSRFQSWLRGGMPVSIDDRLLAKSNTNGHDSKAREEARVRSGYPKGGRHELQSVALLQAAGGAILEGVDWDLLLHLVASHHGWCRPFAPVITDPAPLEVTFSGRTARSDHGLYRVDSGVSERFWRLTRRYGWWGLAYLESILRLTDQRQSEWEERREEEALAVASN